MTDPYQGFADLKWRCGNCNVEHVFEEDAAKCCTAPAVGDDQLAMTPEEIDEER